MKIQMMRTYEELSKLKSYSERLEYLRLDGKVGNETFGYDRQFNQMLYNSVEWKIARSKVILRDNGMDLGVDGVLIVGGIYVHHMNPISMYDIQHSTDNLFNPNFLICVSFDTHNKIHYGISESSSLTYTERTKYDTCPWKRR